MPPSHPKPSPETTERMACAVEPLLGTGAALVMADAGPMIQFTRADCLKILSGTGMRLIAADQAAREACNTPNQALRRRLLAFTQGESSDVSDYLLPPSIS